MVASLTLVLGPSGFIGAWKQPTSTMAPTSTRSGRGLPSSSTVAWAASRRGAAPLLAQRTALACTLLVVAVAARAAVQRHGAATRAVPTKKPLAAVVTLGRGATSSATTLATMSSAKAKSHSFGGLHGIGIARPCLSEPGVERPVAERLVPLLSPANIAPQGHAAAPRLAASPIELQAAECGDEASFVCGRRPARQVGSARIGGRRGRRTSQASRIAARAAAAASAEHRSRKHIGARLQTRPVEEVPPPSFDASRMKFVMQLALWSHTRFHASRQLQCCQVAHSKESPTALGRHSLDRLGDFD